MPEKETTIIDYLYVMVKWRKFILSFTIAAGILTAVTTFILPKWYKATATVLIPQAQSNLNALGMGSNILSSITSKIPSLPVVGNIFGAGPDIDQFLSILESRVAQEYIAEKFDLQKQYREKNLEETVRALRKNVSFRETKKSGGIDISVEDKSPKRASDMANAYVQFLDSLNIRFQTEQAQNNRIFIQERHDKNYQDLKNAEDTLRSFQKLHNVIALPEQIEASIKSYAELRGELSLKEIEYESLARFIGKNHPDIQLLRSQISSINNQLAQFEAEHPSVGNPESVDNYVVPFAETPRIGMEYLRLKREIEIKSILYALLSQQLEQAKIQEARDTPTLLVLDEAVPPVRHSKPKKLLLTVIFSALGFLFSLGYAFLFEHVRVMDSTSPREHQKLLELRKILNKTKQADE